MSGESEITRLSHAYYLSDHGRWSCPIGIEILVNDIDNLQPIKLLTRAEVAEILAVAPKTIANWQSAGSGPPAIRLNGGIIRYEEAALVAWYQANRRVA